VRNTAKFAGPKSFVSCNKAKATGYMTTAKKAAELKVGPEGGEPTAENAGETHDSFSRAVNAQKSSTGGDSLCQIGSIVEARAELHALADSLPPADVVEVSAVARALAADRRRGIATTTTD
jgi:hypothetical protein